MTRDDDDDVRTAHTLPVAQLTCPATFALWRERVFAAGWHLSLDGLDVAAGCARPFVLHPGHLDEPLVWTRDAGGALRCLSNVCTHRANLVCTSDGPARSLRCGYHGRTFELDGRLRSAPGFEDAAAFPAARDDLRAAPHAEWQGLPFVSLAPTLPFAHLVDDLAPWLDGLLCGRLDPASVRSFDVAAHWVLYVDNYLEGFHVPYVHPGLRRALGRYAVHPLTRSVVQVGYAADGADGADDADTPSAAPLLALPPTHPLSGRAVAALYAWLFPATMLNVYPWGVSVNVVTPLTRGRTRVTFADLVHRPELRHVGAGGALDDVELEDEAVVESVQRGIRARLYPGGRYAPRHEAGVHRFHRLLASV